MDEITDRVSRGVSREAERALLAPDFINRHTVLALQSGRVSPDDERALRRLLQDSLRLQEDAAVSSAYFGNQNGHHVGAGENAGTARDGVLDDLRRHPWYRLAARRDGPVWSAVDDDGSGNVSIVRATALRDERSGALLGVVGVELSLRTLRRALSAADLCDGGELFLADANGDVIALRTGSRRVEELPRRSSAPLVGGLTPIADAPGRFVRALGAHVATELGGFGRVQAETRGRLELDGESGYFRLSPIGRDRDLDWSLGVFVPERDHHVPTWSRSAQLVLPFLIASLAAAATFALFARLVTRPLRGLRRGAERIAVGEFDIAIDTDRRGAIGDLTRAIDGMRRRLRASFDTLIEQRLIAEVTLESIADGVVTIDAAGKVRYMNAVAERLTGTDLDAARGRSIEGVFQARDERTGLPMTRGLMLRSLADAHAIGQPVVVTSASGSTHLVHCRVTPVTDEAGRGHGGVLNFSDLSEELRLKSELVHRATHDPLTDLVNRREFERRTTLALGNARRRGSVHTLCYVDLDRFKLVNDSAGHEAGDELLRQIARLLDESVRGGDTVARLGGDEFGVLLEHCTLERAERVMKNLTERIEAFRFHWEGRSYSIGLSAGLVAISEVSVSTIAVLRDADSACYIAKNGGRGRLHVHREDDEALVRLRDDHSWIERIEQALEHDRFMLRAQRIESADIREKRHRHVEILLRLIGEEGEELSPAEFLPAAERYSLASRLDRWVVSHAIDWLVSAIPGGEGPDLCSINLSGQSLGEPAMLPFIVSEIRRSGVCPFVICFEVTETATIANLSNALKLIATLRELGCSFALDDFGSGLSSFAYLKTLPVNYLKIDGVFVRDMLDDPLDLAMVRSINEVGQTMGMRTVAEYVENDALREALCELGVDYVQGYGVGRPEPLDTLEFAVRPERVIESDPV